MSELDIEEIRECVRESREDGHLVWRTLEDQALTGQMGRHLTALCDEVEHLRAERDLMREEISLSAMKTTKANAEAEGDPEGARVGKVPVGIVRFDVTIRVDGAEIDAGVLTAPLRAGSKDGKLQVELLDLREAFAEALDAAEEIQAEPSAMAADGKDWFGPQ